MYSLVGGTGFEPFDLVAFHLMENSKGIKYLYASLDKHPDVNNPGNSIGVLHECIEF